VRTARHLMPWLRLCLFILFFPLAATASERPWEVHPSGNQLEIVLRWQEPVSCRSSQDDQGFLLTCDRPLPAADIYTMAREVPQWLLDVRSGYDSLLLVPAQPGVFSLSRLAADTVVITLRKEDRVAGQTGIADLEAARIRRTQQLRETLLKARALTQLGRTQTARAILEEELARHPMNQELLLGLADVENRSGSWRKAVTLYNRLLSQVDDPAAARNKAALLREHGQNLQVAAAWTETGDTDTQWEQILSGRLFAGNWSSLGFEAENRSVKATGVVDPRGRSADFRGERQRLHLFFDHDPGYNLELTGDLFVARGSGGAGVTLMGKGQDDQGWQAQVRYHEPWWGLLSTLVHQGRRDRVSAGYHRGWRQELSLDLTAAWNRYGLEEAANSTDSVTGSAELVFSPGRGMDHRTLSYRYELEEVLSADERLSLQTGVPFRPVDVSNRRVHLLEWRNAWLAGDYLLLPYSLGYSWDEYGGHGPVLGLGLLWRPLTTVEVEFLATHSALSSRGGEDNDVTRIGCRIGFFF